MIMEISPEEIRRVQASWEKCVPIADKAAELFYGRLFQLDPTLRSMFPADMTEQGKKLMQMITVAVRSLNRLESILEDVQALGARHGEYGVQDDHYDTVAAALLWTLSQALGDEFDARLEAAWTNVYTILASAMQAGAKTAVKPEPAS